MPIGGKNKMVEQKSNAKKAGTLAAIAGLVIGGAGVALVDQAPEPIDTQPFLDQITALEAQVASGDLTIAEMEEQLADLNSYVDDNQAAIDAVVLEDQFEEYAKEHLEDKNYKLKRWLSNHFGYDIDEEDDLEITFLNEVDVDVEDAEDGEATVEFEIKVKNDDDNGEEFREYVKVKVDFEDFEADSIRFMEA